MQYAQKLEVKFALSDTGRLAIKSAKLQQQLKQSERKIGTLESQKSEQARIPRVLRPCSCKLFVPQMFNSQNRQQNTLSAERWAAYLRDNTNLDIVTSVKATSSRSPP